MEVVGWEEMLVYLLPLAKTVWPVLCMRPYRGLGAKVPQVWVWGLDLIDSVCSP